MPYSEIAIWEFYLFVHLECAWKLELAIQVLPVFIVEVYVVKKKSPTII